MASERSIEKEEFWRLAIDEHSRSGLTIKEFCRRQGLAAYSFSWWKREIKKRDGIARAKANAPSGSDGNALVPVKVVADAIPKDAKRPTEDVVLDVLSPSGYTLSIRADTPSPRLTELLNAVTACDAIGGKTSC